MGVSEPTEPTTPEEALPVSEEVLPDPTPALPPLPEQSAGESPESPSPVEEALASDVPGPGDPGPATTFALPVRVDNRSRRSDNDALEGLFCDVVAGEHEGRTGVFDRVLEYDRQTGYPKTILVITRDADNLSLPVAYEDARPSASTGSR